MMAAMMQRRCLVWQRRSLLWLVRDDGAVVHKTAILALEQRSRTKQVLDDLTEATSVLGAPLAAPPHRSAGSTSARSATEVTRTSVLGYGSYP